MDNRENSSIVGQKEINSDRTQYEEKQFILETRNNEGSGQVTISVLKKPVLTTNFQTETGDKYKIMEQIDDVLKESVENKPDFRSEVLENYAEKTSENSTSQLETKTELKQGGGKLDKNIDSVSDGLITGKHFYNKILNKEKRDEIEHLLLDGEINGNAFQENKERQKRSTFDSKYISSISLVPIYAGSKRGFQQKKDGGRPKYFLEPLKPEPLIEVSYEIEGVRNKDGGRKIGKETDMASGKINGDKMKEYTLLEGDSEVQLDSTFNFLDNKKTKNNLDENSEHQDFDNTFHEN